MKKPVIISITGTQDIGDEDINTIEFITDGQFQSRTGSHYITYDETEITGMEGVSTTVTVEGDNRITITRTGKLKSQLILEKGKRHLCPYTTEYGEMMMGVNTGNIESTLTNKGGSLSVDYSLEINHSFASNNRFEISVKEVNNTNDKSYSIS
jgi:uncharacterized beta-barrel protein YwiB (DUF1934 family)